MSGIIFVNAGVGKGKTKSCLHLVKRAREDGVGVGGIVSPRVFSGTRLVGYDAIDCATGRMFPLARIHAPENDPDWFTFGHLGYFFSRMGFVRANEILCKTAQSPNSPPVMIVDEVGRLEMKGEGLYSGLMDVVDNLVGGESVVVLSCRSDVLGWTQRLLKDHTVPHISWTPGEPEELWWLVEPSLLGSS